MQLTTHLDFCFTVSSSISNQCEFEARLIYKVEFQDRQGCHKEKPYLGKTKNQPTNKTVVISKCWSNSMCRRLVGIGSMGFSSRTVAYYHN